MKAALVVHRERPEAADLARVAAAWLRAAGHEVVMLDEDAAAAGLEDLAVPPDELVRADLAISLGGDGTMLRAVDLVSGYGVPVIGVNVGRLGYLEEVEPGALTTALDRFAEGRLRVEERMMLDVAIEAAGTVSVYRALNEAVVEKTEPGHTVRLGVSIDGAAFTSYAADGLIVATPTGSTAYSLSARGPIMSPHCEALLVTPVSPHMLFDRSMVLAPDEAVDITVLGHRSATVTIDGRSVAVLAPGDQLHCRRATPPARLVRYGEHSFHQVLKAKFGLSDR